MAYDLDLAERVRALLADEPVVEKRMFGGLAFLHDGQMSVSVSGQGGLLLRVDPEEWDELLREPGADEFVMRGRSMRGWLRVAPEVLDDDEVLGAWVTRSLDWARAQTGR